MIYRLLADLIVIVHVAYVGFVLLGLLLILLGLYCRVQGTVILDGAAWLRNCWLWRAARNFTFRMLHFLAMAIVGFEAMAGYTCPLTTWENDLRELGGQLTYEGETFLGYWAHEILFYDAPTELFNQIYIWFTVLLLVILIVVPPRLPRFRRSAAPAPQAQPAPLSDPVIITHQEPASAGA